MRKLFITVFNMLTALFFYGQVGINNANALPDNSAMLDVKSVNRGLLVPRIALTGNNDITTIPSPATSLLIYNTATTAPGSTGVTPGYYYYSGSLWVPLLVPGSLSASVWQLSGNIGTNPATHFIGTVDNADLQFKVDAKRTGYLTSNGNVLWGVEAGNVNTGVNNI